MRKKEEFEDVQLQCMRVLREK